MGNFNRAVRRDRRVGHSYVVAEPSIQFARTVVLVVGGDSLYDRDLRIVGLVDSFDRRQDRIDFRAMMVRVPDRSTSVHALANAGRQCGKFELPVFQP